MSGHNERRLLPRQNPWETRWVNVWVNDPPPYPSGPTVRPEIPKHPSHFIPTILKLVAVVVVGCIIVAIVVSYLSQRKSGFQAHTSWGGDDYQFHALPGDINRRYIILNIDALNKGEFSGSVFWPDYGYTVTKVEGTIVTNVARDTRWKYVIHSKGQHLQFADCSNGTYLRFTESAYIRGTSVPSVPSVPLKAEYYAVVCDGNLSGVWFYPDKPNDRPGGEFALQE